MNVGQSILNKNFLAKRIFVFVICSTLVSHLVGCSGKGVLGDVSCSPNNGNDGSSNHSSTAMCRAEIIPVAAPTLVTTWPASGANSEVTRVRGQAPVNTVVTVYSEPGCVNALASGSSEEFENEGIPITVVDGSTTSLWASAALNDETFSIACGKKPYCRQEPTCTGTLEYIDQPGLKTRMALPDVALTSLPRLELKTTKNGHFNHLFYTAHNGTNRKLWRTDGSPVGTLETSGSPANPTSLIVRGPDLFYTLLNGDRELWMYHSSTESSSLVKDIFSGASSSMPTDLIILGDLLYFAASDAVNNKEVWVSDGTEAGTSQLLEVAPGLSSYGPENLYAAKNVFYFSGNANDGLGSELWVSDGTAAGTFALKDICPGSCSSDPDSFTLIGNSVFFNAYDPVNGREPWVTDGTSSGTFLLKDTFPGSGTGFGFGFVQAGSTIFFIAQDAASNLELWKTDGSPSGTELVAEINATGSSNPSYLISFQNKVFFVASDGINGVELWASDGTALGTALIKNIHPGIVGSSISKLFVYNDKLYFLANDGSGFEVWTSDGTDQGTFKQTSLSGSDATLDYIDSGAINAEGVLFFSARSLDGFKRLWTYAL